MSTRQAPRAVCATSPIKQRAAAVMRDVTQAFMDETGFSQEDLRQFRVVVAEGSDAMKEAINRGELTMAEVYEQLQLQRRHHREASTTGQRPKRHRATRDEMADRHLQLAVIVQEQAPMTVRQVFYQAVVRGIIDKTDAGYNAVQRAVVDLRRLGWIPWADIADSSRNGRKQGEQFPSQDRFVIRHLAPGPHDPAQPFHSLPHVETVVFPSRFLADKCIASGLTIDAARRLLRDAEAEAAKTDAAAST